MQTMEQLQTLSTPDLVSLYNKTTGKSIKSFHTRAKGVEQTWAALKAATDQPTSGGATKEATVTRGAVVKPAKEKAVKAAKPKKAPRIKGTPAKRWTKKDYPAGFDPAEYVIHVKDEFRRDNPKRANSSASKIFAILVGYHGKTVAAFAKETKEKILALGARPMGELNWCLGKGFVELKKK